MREEWSLVCWAVVRAGASRPGTDPGAASEGRGEQPPHQVLTGGCLLDRSRRRERERHVPSPRGRRQHSWFVQPPAVRCGWKAGSARRGNLRLERGWGCQIQDRDTVLKGPRAAGAALGGPCAGQPWHSAPSRAGRWDRRDAGGWGGIREEEDKEARLWGRGQGPEAQSSGTGRGRGRSSGSPGHPRPWPSATVHDRRFRCCVHTPPQLHSTP